MKPSAARLVPAALLLLFVALLLWRLVFLGQALYWGDLSLYFYPQLQVVQNALREGRLPLWNPYVYCGEPLVGNPQSWVFYPTTPLLLVMPVWLYVTVNSALHLFLAGLGAYLFLRRICGDRMGALFGGMVFSGSGFLAARLQFPTMIMASAWLPWLLILVDRTIERPRAWYFAMLSGVVGLTLLAGHAQIAYMSFACATLYALVRLLQVRRRHRGRAGRALLEMAGALVLGCVLSCIQLLPTLQLFRASIRGHLTWEETNRFLLTPVQLINFLAPNYFGSPRGGDYWGSGNAWEPCVFVGLLPLALAVFAVVSGARRLAVRFFALFALTSLILAMGKLGGLYFLAYYVVPGIASFHDPARFTFLTTFSLAALTAIGMRLLRERGVTAAWRAVVVALGAANLLWFSAGFYPSLPATSIEPKPADIAALPRAGEGRVFTAVRENVWRRYIAYGDFGPVNGGYPRDVADSLTPNVAMPFGVEEAGGYEPVPLRGMRDIELLALESVVRHGENLPELLTLLNATQLVLPEGTRFPHPDLRPLHQKGRTVYAAATQTPRAWLVRRTVRVDGAQRSLAAISDPEFDLYGTAVISGAGDAEVEATEGKHAIGALNPVRVLHEDAALMEAHVDCGGAPGFLVWSHAFYPGWQARVDGRSVPLMRTDHALSGLPLPAGEHTVRIRYQPWAFRAGAYLSLAVVALVVGSLAFGAAIRPTTKRAG